MNENKSAILALLLLLLNGNIKYYKIGKIAKNTWQINKNSVKYISITK